MTLFSQRKGLKPIKTEIQKNFMDSALRTRLWNSLRLNFWNEIERSVYSTDVPNPTMKTFLDRMWNVYFVKPLDEMPILWSLIHEEIKEYFFHCEWFEVYDFIEFVANRYPSSRYYSASLQKEIERSESFILGCNRILKRELSAYRFIDGKIVEITSEEEIIEIEKALAETVFLRGVNTHLKTALKLFSDRKNPDYRNSIKESISAVEGMCQLITKNKNITLGQALKSIEKEKIIELPGALKKAFSCLYGYTSTSKDGIRHAMLDEAELDSEDAKFMLATCSAFVNYLIVKSEKAGIKLAVKKGDREEDV